MGWGNVVILSVLTVGVAVFFTLDCFDDQREAVFKLLNTCPLHWFNKNTKLTSPDGTYNVVSAASDRLYTKEELAEYHGGDGSPGLYLAILGRVYDVEKGRKHYAEGKGYGFFRGEYFHPKFNHKIVH